MRLSFNGPYPGRPFRSSLDQVDVGLVSPQGILPLILFEKVDLKPRLFSLPAGRLALDYAAETNKGYVLGYMAWRPLAKDSLCFEIREMDLPDFTLPGLPGQGRISGRLTGTLIVEGQEQAMPSGGRGLFKIGPGRISGLSLPQVPAGDLDFKLLTLEFDLDPQGMNFTKISLDGGQTGVELTGRVDNYQNPWLNLTGTARLGPADQPMFSAPIQITGPATSAPGEYIIAWRYAPASGVEGIVPIRGGHYKYNFVSLRRRYGKILIIRTSFYLC